LLRKKSLLNETPYTILLLSTYNTRHEICVTKVRIGYPTIEQIAKYTFPPTDSARTVSSYIVHEMILVIINIIAQYLGPVRTES